MRLNITVYTEISTKIKIKNYMTAYYKKHRRKLIDKNKAYYKTKRRSNTRKKQICNEQVIEKEQEKLETGVNQQHQNKS